MKRYLPALALIATLLVTTASAVAEDTCYSKQCVPETTGPPADINPDFPETPDLATSGSAAGTLTLLGLTVILLGAAMVLLALLR